MDIDFLWQHMYRKTMALAERHRHVAIKKSQWQIAFLVLW